MRLATQKLLTPEESDRLSELEKQIERGRKTWIAAGEALIEIRESKLYRTEHKTFDDYCRAKWEFTKQHVYRLIECAPIAKSNTRVTSIRQAQEVSKVPEEKRAEVIDIASTKAQSEDRPMTAKDIKEAATQAEPETIPDPPALRTQDDAWKKAIGCTDARNFFAGQLEDIGTSCIESGTVDQIKAFKLQCEVWAKKAASSITKKLQSAK